MTGRTLSPIQNTPFQQRFLGTWLRYFKSEEQQLAVFQLSHCRHELEFVIRPLLSSALLTSDELD